MKVGDIISFKSCTKGSLCCECMGCSHAYYNPGPVYRGKIILIRGNHLSLLPSAGLSIDIESDCVINDKIERMCSI